MIAVEMETRGTRFGTTAVVVKGFKFEVHKFVRMYILNVHYMDHKRGHGRSIERA